MNDWESPLLTLLSYSPGLSAREIASRLRREGFDVDKHQINRFIYYDARFETDNGRIPCWRLSGTAASSTFTRDGRGATRQARRAELDRREGAVASVKAGVAPVGGVDDELRQAIALLRSRGISVGDVEAAPTRARTSTPRAAPGPPAQRSPARLEMDGHRRSGSPVSLAPSRPALPIPSWSLALRPWQEEALTHWYDAGGVGVCEAVTGTGKTHLGLEAVAQCFRRGERATVLVPSVLLQRQWHQQFQNRVPEVSIAKVGGVPHGDPETADVVIAVVNSAMKTDLTAFGSGMMLLVADEVHRYGGEAWSTALRHGYDYRLGLTATLERGSDEGVAEILMPYFGSIAHHYGYDRATRERVVAPFDLVFLGVRLEAEEQAEYDTLSRRISQARKILIGAGANPQKLNQQLGALRSMGGDVTRAVMTYESATRERRRLLADTQAKQEALLALAEVVGESRGTVIFTQSKETADAAAGLLEDYGLRAAAIYSEGMSPAQRQALIDALGDEELDALAAPRILDEGVDIPDIDLGIVMGASSSRRQMIQRLGRVIRLKSDGRRARFVILYVVDSVEDPASGSRDDFMDEVEDAATKVVLFEEWDETTIDVIWSGAAPAWTRDPDVHRPSDLPAPVILATPQGVAPPAATVQEILAAQAARRVAQKRTETPLTEPPRPPASEPRPIVPRTRISRPLPRPQRPAYPDPVEVADLLDSIDETIALVEWVRSELAAPKAG